ncbi:exonuclease V [Lipomyces arxii]|uniref:exonuclease V n=1 Tax=Lipomyces arxii TaxID=56418 RepID=UPI0034CE5677
MLHAEIWVSMTARNLVLQSLKTFYLTVTKPKSSRYQCFHTVPRTNLQLQNFPPTVATTCASSECKESAASRIVSDEKSIDGKISPNNILDSNSTERFYAQSNTQDSSFQLTQEKIVSRSRSASPVTLSLELPNVSDAISEQKHDITKLLRRKRRRSSYIESKGFLENQPDEEEQSKMLPLHFRDAENLNDSMIQTYKGGSRLSVSDICGPSYCELQYFYRYYLQEFKQTAAMKRGTEIHNKLEQESTKKVVVDVEHMSSEDKNAVELINMLLQLQTLTQDALTQSEAITREFRVFGYLGDVYVSGIIDKLTYDTPGSRKGNFEFLDANIMDTEITGPTVDSFNQDKPATFSQRDPVFESLESKSQKNQASILSFLRAQSDDVSSNFLNEPKDGCEEKLLNGISRQIRIADIKTRLHRTLPPESQSRSTYYQLLLYWRLFADLVDDKFDFERFTKDFKMDINAKLSDDFRKEVLSDDFTVKVFEKELRRPNAQLSFEYSYLLRNLQTLKDVWTALRLKFAEFRGKINTQMSVLYIYQANKKTFAGTDFTFNESDLQNKMKDSLEYWRAQRDPIGVEIEEAYKCRSCDFADRCPWRLEKIKESTERNRERFQNMCNSKDRFRSSPIGQIVVEREVD